MHSRAQKGKFHIWLCLNMYLSNKMTLTADIFRSNVFPGMNSMLFWATVLTKFSIPGRLVDLEQIKDYWFIYLQQTIQVTEIIPPTNLGIKGSSLICLPMTLLPCKDDIYSSAIPRTT